MQRFDEGMRQPGDSGNEFRRQPRYPDNSFGPEALRPHLSMGLPLSDGAGKYSRVYAHTITFLGGVAERQCRRAASIGEELAAYDFDSRSFLLSGVGRAKPGTGFHLGRLLMQLSNCADALIAFAFGALGGQACCIDICERWLP